MQVTPNVPAPFLLSLSTPAPAGGVTVTLDSSDPSRVVVTPASVVVPEGATTPALQPQVTGVGIGLATITAASPGYTSSVGTVTVTAPTLAFTGSPLVIGIGMTGNLTLSLSGGQAPPGGLTVSLVSSAPSQATVPAAVSFAAGATSATVTVTGGAAGSVTITASAPGIASATASVTVTPPPTVTAAYAINSLALANVLLTNTSAVTAINLRIVSLTNITAAAPNVIALSPNNNVFPISYGNVAGGKAGINGAIFTATAGSLSVPFSFTITYLADNMPSRTAVINVLFPRAMDFAGGPLTISVSHSGNLTLNLLGNQAPAAGLTVTLISSDPSRATVPATVSFAPGATSVAVPVTGLAPGSVVITASASINPLFNPATATATVNVTGALSVPANTPVRLGQSAAFVVTLPAPAPAGGVKVALASSDVAKVTVTPGSVVIPQGATTAATPPQVTGAGLGAATITASANGYTSGAGAVTVTAPTMAFTGSPPSIVTGLTGTLTLSLSGGQAPAGGLTVSLVSNSPSQATVPATVGFAAGATSATVTVTGGVPGSTTITASAPGLASATVSVTVTPPPTVTAAYAANFLQVINVIMTNTSAVTAINLRIVSLTNITAPPPTVIALTPNNAFPISYGNVAGGKTALNGAIFTATAGSIEVPFSFTITYLADNMPPQTAVIHVPFPRLMDFSGSPLALNAGASGNLTLNLLGSQAPAGGLTVTLSSSDPSRATVPATVSFAPGATSVAVPVTGLAPGAVVITATATVVSFPATTTATVNVTGAISVPANTPVRLGQSAAFVVTLPAPAPAGGVKVALASSDVSKVTVTPGNVVIPQGATTAATPPQVTGAGLGAATITASAKDYTSGTGAVTVTPPPTVIAAYGLNSPQVTNVVLINTSAVAAINVRITSLTITAPAPNVIVPPDNAIPRPFGDLAGGEGKASTWVFRATAGSVDVPFTLTMTLEADNMAPRTAVVNVPFPRAMSFAGSPLAIRQGTSGTLTLNLTGIQAPAEGLTVSLSSSDRSRATVPPTVTFAAGTATVAVRVAGVAPGTAVITASANVNTFFNPAIATATVNVV